MRSFLRENIFKEKIKFKSKLINRFANSNSYLDQSFQFLDIARIYLPCGLGPNNFENIVKLITLVME